MPATEKAPDERSPFLAGSCRAQGPRFSDIINRKRSLQVETIHSLLSFSEGCPGCNENSPSKHLPDQPENLLPLLTQACKGELGWGQACPLTLHLKARLAKPPVVSDSPRSMIKGFFFLKRKITFNHSVSGDGTLLSNTWRLWFPFLPPTAE